MSLRRIVLGFVVLLLVIPSFAASIGERSPFAQGHWSDPSHSGNGFEIFSTADQVAVVWFTYDAAGRPIWYTAQGDLASPGTQSWPLLQHRWSDGRIGATIVAGSLRLNVRHPESADIIWELGDRRGTWAIQPLLVSGVINEVTDRQICIALTA